MCNSSQLMSITAVLIGVLALLFTIFSFWWMNWRKGSIVIANVRSYAIAGAKKLYLQLPLIFYNPGARPVMLENLRVQFLNENRKEEFLFFNATVEKLGTDEGRSFATPFAVHGGKAREVICEFQCVSSTIVFEPKSYQFKIQALYTNNKKWRTLKIWDLKVRESQVQGLNSNGLSIQDNEPQLGQP